MEPNVARGRIESTMSFSKRCASFRLARTDIALAGRKPGPGPAAFLILLLLQLPAGCSHRTQPGVTFSKIPVAASGGKDNVAVFEGDVQQSLGGQRLVLYAKSNEWWLQPDADHPFTQVLPGGHWKQEVHLGSDYAAVLVDASFKPKDKLLTLPPVGAGVAAVSVTPGSTEGPFHTTQPTGTIHFSGYDWLVRISHAERLGPHSYSQSNVSLDERGFLHLRITKSAGGWVCSEAKLGRSLGYGTYTFTVEDTAHLEPAAVLQLYTWSDAALAYDHREMNINLSRWGHAVGNNAEFIIQPFYVKTNSFRFLVPPGLHTYSFRWEPGSAVFRSVSGSGAAENQNLVASHAFGGNIPPPGDEALTMTFCEFGMADIPLKQEAEIVVERFQYLP